MMPTQPTTSLLVVASRIFWMVFGPMILAMLTFSIVNQGSGWLTPQDLAFFLVLGGLPLARWLEFRRGNPMTSGGEPATEAHLRRYALGVVLFGLGVWTVANLLGNHWLPR